MDSVERSFTRISPADPSAILSRPVAVEMPIAIEINGIGYAVMMATPTDLVDFAYGFAHSERLIDEASDILDVAPHKMDNGVLLRITLNDARLDRVVERVRHRVSESSCGLCGIENLEQALRPLPSVTSRSRADPPAIFRALGELGAYQPLNRATGAVHAAALCAADGLIRFAREDVGRHNAFDKLIGAMLREGTEWDGGFALLSARCSYELVEKAVLADCPMLVTVSMATSLALARAEEAGLALIVLARADALLAAADAGGYD
jgi:FdhD protein